MFLRADHVDTISHTYASISDMARPQTWNLMCSYFLHNFVIYQSRVQLKVRTIKVVVKDRRQKLLLQDYNENCSAIFIQSEILEITFLKSGTNLCERSVFWLPGNKRVCVPRISCERSQRFLFNIREVSSHERSRAHDLERQ